CMIRLGVTCSSECWQNVPLEGCIGQCVGGVYGYVCVCACTCTSAVVCVCWFGELRLRNINLSGERKIIATVYVCTFLLQFPVVCVSECVCVCERECVCVCVCVF